MILKDIWLDKLLLDLCVGTSTGNKNEILELGLPDKMLQSEDDGVCIVL